MGQAYPTKAASQEWQQLFEQLPYGIVWIDSEERVIGCNPAVGELLDLLPHQLYQQRIDVLFSDWSSEAATVAGERQCAFRVHGVRSDGGTIPLEAHLHPVNPSSGDHRLHVVTVRDLRPQERLTQSSLRIAEQERQSVGRDLHDVLGQSLIGLALLADELAASLSRDGETEAGTNAALAQQLAQRCRETCGLTRTLVRGLVPIGLGDGSLGEALRDLASSCASLYGVECQADCAALSLPPEVNSHLFRIAQEATTNALKHSGCDRLRIVLSQVGDKVMLTVKDNGKGISESGLRHSGSGLDSIRHRCQLIGARLSIAQPSRGDTGVNVAWSVPKPTQLAL